MATIYKPSLLYHGFLTLPFSTPIFLLLRTTTYFFHQHFRFLTYNYDDRALRDPSADSAMTSPLLLADWSCYAASFPRRPITGRRGTRHLVTRLFRYRQKGTVEREFQ